MARRCSKAGDRGLSTVLCAADTSRGALEAVYTPPIPGMDNCHHGNGPTDTHHFAPNADPVPDKAHQLRGAPQPKHKPIRQPVRNQFAYREYAGNEYPSMNEWMLTRKKR